MHEALLLRAQEMLDNLPISFRFNRVSLLVSNKVHITDEASEPASFAAFEGFTRRQPCIIDLHLQ